MKKSVFIVANSFGKMYKCHTSAKILPTCNICDAPSRNSVTSLIKRTSRNWFCVNHREVAGCKRSTRYVGTV
jgi:hypothetical protein